MKRKRYNYPKLVFAIIITIALVFGIPYAVIHSISLEMKIDGKRFKLTEPTKEQLATIFDQIDDSEYNKKFEKLDEISSDDYIEDYIIECKKGFSDQKTFRLYLPYDENALIVESEASGNIIKLKDGVDFNKRTVYMGTPKFFKQYMEANDKVAFELKTSNGKDSIEQGEVAYLIAKNIYVPSYLNIFIDDKPVEFTKLEDGSRHSYVVTISSTYLSETGKRNIKFIYDSELAPRTYETSLMINPREFSEQNLTIAEDKIKEKRTEDARKELKAEMAKVFSKEQYQRIGDVDDFMHSFELPVEGVLTTEYGVTRYVNNQLSPYTHTGLDIACPEGTNVKTTALGKVVFADELTLTGNTVVISHGHGIYSSYYHLSSMCCKEGDVVLRGEMIGDVGTTGFSTGSHLHFEISHKDKRLEPGYFIYGKPVTYQNYQELFSTNN